MGENELHSPKRDMILEKVNTAPKCIIAGYNFSFDASEPTAELLERARVELRETPETRETAINELRELLKSEPDLITPDDVEFYEKFLRPCKWYSKSAFELIKRFYKFRANNPRYCKDLIPSKNREAFVAGLCTPMPIRNSDGGRVLVLECGKKWKPKEVSLDQIFRNTMIALDAAITETVTQVSGVRVIVDMEGLSLGQVPYFSPFFASKVAEWVQRCLPCRLKGIHIINQPYIFNMVFALFKPFLLEKIRKRLHFHGTDRESLLKFVDAKALPKRFGGELDFPPDPVGEPLADYFAHFDELYDITSNRVGYIKST